MTEVIQFDDGVNVIECKNCANQSFFIVMDESNDIIYFECSNVVCKQRIKFNTITLFKGGEEV